MSILTAGKGDSKYNIHISNKIFSKNILHKYINKKNKVLIITDDGIPILAGDHTTENRPTQVNRNKLIVEKMLLDSDFLVYADNRIISSITPNQKSSKFEN